MRYFPKIFNERVSHVMLVDTKKTVFIRSCFTIFGGFIVIIKHKKIIVRAAAITQAFIEKALF